MKASTIMPHQVDATTSHVRLNKKWSRPENQCLTQIQNLLTTKNVDELFTPTLKRIFNLTKRELEIMALIVDGKTATVISKELYISKKTVEKHIENMKQRLGCKKLTELTFEFGKLLAISILTAGDCQQQVAA